MAEGGHATEADLEGGGYAGSILLAERGGGAGGGPVYFSDKERNAADAGAAALVVYNSGDGPYLGELVHEFSPEGYSPRIPTVSMSGEDGREIAGMLAGRGGEGLEGTLLVLHDPDAVAQFSSRGPVSPFYVKPDLAAPGAFINTTQAGGGYNFTSGTSFAAPHVAGAAALLLERSPWLRPEEVRSILVSTADPSGAGLGAAGAGRLNVTAALGASLAPSPSHVSFDLSPAGPEDSAGLLLEAVRGRAGAGGGGPPRVEVDAPDGVLASHEVRDAGNGSWAVDVSARLAPDAPAAPGTGEGMVTARDGASRYSVPAIFRIAEGTVLASEEGGRVSFAVEGPGGWRYARITATDSETGARVRGGGQARRAGLGRGGPQRDVLGGGGDTPRGGRRRRGVRRGRGARGAGGRGRLGGRLGGRPRHPREGGAGGRRRLGRGAGGRRRGGEGGRAPAPRQAAGPAALTSGGASGNFLKLSANMCASFLADRSYESFSCQVPRGSSTLRGTPGHSSGTSRLNRASCLYRTMSSRPESMSVTIALLCPMLMRLPTPYGPPDHPVLTRYTTVLCSAMRLPSSPAYTDAGLGMNGAAKHSEKTALGSFIPLSVPASLLVYPDMKWYMAPSRVRRETGGRTPRASAVRNTIVRGCVRCWARRPPVCGRAGTRPACSPLCCRPQSPA